MIKCLAFICLLGLTVSAWEFDNKRSNRMNLLSKTVGARMLAGTNDFQMTDNGNQFVPIPRQSTPAISNIVDSGVNGQQLTPDQIQQLHQFINSQSVGQQQQQQNTQFQQQQPMGGQQQFQQNPAQQTMGQQFQSPAQQQTVGQQFQSPAQQQTVGQQFQPQQQFGQQPQQQQFGQQSQQQFRMDSFNTNPMTFDNTQQQQPQPFGRMVSSFPTTTTTTTTTTPAPIVKPDARMQQMNEQLFNIQQQQARMNQQQQTVVPTQQQQQQQPITPLQQQQLQQQQQQQQQFVQQQKMIEQQQQLQQQMTQRPVQQQQPVQTMQKVPQMQVASIAQPVMNVSRIATPVRQQQQQPVFQQQPFVPQSQQRGRSGDFCAGATPGDKLPHPVVETQYVVCGELGEIYIMDCPSHTVFNPHLKLCDLTTDMPLLCKSNPCLNGAKCVDISETQFRCECPLGFSGQTCEKFDTCSTSQPCGQDGVCLSFALGSPIPHVCLCQGGRSVGMTCAQSEQNPCLVSGSSTKLMPVNFNRAVFAHCEGARPHFKFCQPPLVFSPAKQSCEWTL